MTLLACGQVHFLALVQRTTASQHCSPIAGFDLARSRSACRRCVQHGLVARSADLSLHSSGMVVWDHRPLARCNAVSSAGLLREISIGSAKHSDIPPSHTNCSIIYVRKINLVDRWLAWCDLNSNQQYHEVLGEDFGNTTE